jgi:exopolysaccharide production protein ExoY
VSAKDFSIHSQSVLSVPPHVTARVSNDPGSPWSGSSFLLHMPHADAPRSFESSTLFSDLGGCFDRILGVFLLFVASPIFMAAAISIAILSGRSPLVAHLRVGQHGHALWMLKLRTMWSLNDARPSECGWVQRIVAEPESDVKGRDDVRICSKFAAFCRRHSIDELPQLLHVVWGEMSLVGPRPLTITEIRKHYGVLASDLLSVKPGLTGLWQTQGRSALNWSERVQLDLDYVRKGPLRTYFVTLYRTLPVLITGKGAW